jgi:hypothetical protein
MVRREFVEGFGLYKHDGSTSFPNYAYEGFDEEKNFILPNHISTNIPIALVTLTNIRGNSCKDVKSLNFKFGLDCN